MTAERRSGERGFTIIELIVSLAVLMVAMLIANWLLLEAVRIYAATGRELREPVSELALRMLRDDIRASAPQNPLLTTGPLNCQRSTGTMRWELVGDRLQRHSFGPLGEDLGVRPMLDRVEVFNWSVPSPGIVVATVVRRIPTGTSAIHAPTSAWKSSSETRESATVVTASRLEPPPVAP